MKRYYLQPPLFRHGNPVLVVTRKDGDRCELGVFHALKGEGNGQPKRGNGSEYQQYSGIRISEELHAALVKESKANARKYRARKEQ